MENATKALLIAGGVLIAIIIISVLVITLQKTGNVSKTYDKTVQTEEITKFNANFTKYLGQNLTLQEALTIYNFGKDNNVQVNVVHGNTHYTNCYDESRGVLKMLNENGEHGQIFIGKGDIAPVYDTKTGKIKKITIVISMQCP